VYNPRSYRIDDLATLHAFIEAYGFATLFSQTADGPFATHIPFLLDRTRGSLGTLSGHVARANPHWRSFGDGAVNLVAFLGPHAYVSPSWYTDPVTVPTWNYTAVHITGRPVLIEDSALLREHVLRMVAAHAGANRPPWDPAVAADRIEGLLEAIVGFDIEITTIEGKFKLSQNRSHEDQAGVASALEISTREDDRAIAPLMRQNLDRSGR
jgi:transcriptional regulator